MYIGTQPYSGIRARHTYTATAGQTSFSGAGAENVTLTYADELYIDVYQNGVKLSPADYTATSGTTVVLGTGATVSDIIEVIKYDAFSVADTVSAKDGGGFGGNISTSGTLAVTGTSAFTGAITSNAGVVVDEMTLDGDTLTATDDFILDVAGVINLDSDGGGIYFKDGGTTIAEFINNSSDFELKVAVQDKDIRLRGNDGGTAITALTLDMSAAGEATFNDNIVMGTANKGIHLGVTSATASNLLDDYEEGTWTPSISQPSNRVGTWASSVVGTYTKVGRKVTVHASINGSGMRFSATSGYTAMTGLPFAATQPTNSTAYAGSWTGSSVAASSGGSVYLHNTTSYLHSSNSGQASDGVGNIGVTITYFTA